MSIMSARAAQLTLIRSRDLELLQLAQGGSTSLVARRPQCVLHGLQAGLPVVMLLGEDAARQLVYFPRNLLMNCNSLFFLLGPSTSLLDRAKMADLFVDADQLVVELLETTELVNLPLRFA